MADHDHEVTSYDDAAALARRIAVFVADGLASGEKSVMLARPALRLAVDETLEQLGVDAVAAEGTGQYLPLDAAEAMSRFLVEGVPEAERFMELASEIMPADGTPIRAFGEMVSLLWERGSVVEALRLETLWTSYERTRPIQILCSYPSSTLAASGLGDVARLCELHTGVEFAGDYAPNGATGPGDDVATGVLLPVPAAVGAARHFVVDVLRGWGRRDLAGDAALVVSELATNAVMHGGSPFRTSLHREGDSVRVAVEDVAPTWPERHNALPSDLDGRGIAIVEALASASGCSVSAEGKLAWAELSA